MTSDDFSVLYHREGDTIRIDGFVPRNIINNNKYISSNNMFNDVCNKANSLLDDMPASNDEINKLLLPMPDMNKFRYYD